MRKRPPRLDHLKRIGAPRRQATNVPQMQERHRGRLLSHSRSVTSGTRSHKRKGMPVTARGRRLTLIQREHETLKLVKPKVGHRRGYHLSAATRAKISAALRGKHHPHKGHPMSAATRAKISAALKGHPVSASTRAKISRALTGKTRR